MNVTVRICIRLVALALAGASLLAQRGEPIPQQLGILDRLVHGGSFTPPGRLKAPTRDGERGELLRRLSTRSTTSCSSGLAPS